MSLGSVPLSVLTLSLSNLHQTCVECSALLPLNISEVFFFAQTPSSTRPLHSTTLARTRSNRLASLPCLESFA